MGCYSISREYSLTVFLNPLSISVALLIFTHDTHEWLSFEPSESELDSSSQYELQTLYLKNRTAGKTNLTTDKIIEELDKEFYYTYKVMDTRFSF